MTSYIRVNPAEYKKLILENADNSNHRGYPGYPDTDLTSDDQKARFLAHTLQHELGWRIDQKGLQAACLDWLQGLASACTIPFANYQIIQWGQEKTGNQFTDDQAYRFVDTYWHRSAQALADIVRPHLKKVNGSYQLKEG